MRRQHYDERRAISTDGRPIPLSSGNHTRNDFAGGCGLVLIKRDYKMWHDAGRRSMREGTRARENDEVDVDCSNTPEDIHHTLVANNDVECMLAQVEGYSRNRKLDELWCGRGHSWNALQSRPQADDGMPIRPCEALKWRGAVGNGRFQVTRFAAKRDPLTSARGRIRLSIRTETPYESSGQKPRVDTAWSRTLTARRGGSERSRSDVIEQSQRHGRMSAEGPDEASSVAVPKRTLTCVKSRPRAVWNVANKTALHRTRISCV